MTARCSPEVVDLLTRLTERLVEEIGGGACATLLIDDGNGPLRAMARAGEEGASREPLDMDAIVSVPIPGHDVPLGVVRVGRRCERLTAMERDFIELVARLAGLAIERDATRGCQPLTWRQIEPSLDLRDEPVLARNSTGRLIHINAAARALIGMDLDEPISQIEATQIIRSLDIRDQWGQRIRPSMLPNARLFAGLAAPDLVVSCKRAGDRDRRWILLHAAAYTDAPGQAALVVTLMRDFAAIQIHDASQRLRARIAHHLCAPPADFAAVEREIGAFIDGTCAIAVRSREPALSGRFVMTAPCLHGPRPGPDPDACEAGIELNRIGGHLHHLDSIAPEPGRSRMSTTGHVAALPIAMDGTRFGTMTCWRSQRQAAFCPEELDLLREIAGQIGLSVAVDSLRRSLDDDEQRIVEISRRLRAAEETERRRMALSIHDGLAQVAASVCQQLEIVTHRFVRASDDEEAELGRALALAQRTVQEARQLVAGLRPVTLDGQGLTAAVLEEVQRMRADGWAVRYVDGVSDSRYDPDLELALYRIVQEALSNIRKHAGAVPVEVALEQTGTAIHVHIRDHGPGFEPDSVQGTSCEHIGLEGMRERISQFGGTILIDSERGRGTTVVATVPLHPRFARG